MLKGQRYSAYEWCNALLASDTALLYDLCRHPLARACINDSCLVGDAYGQRRRMFSPLEFAIANVLDPERVRILIDRGGAEPTTAALQLACKMQNWHVYDFLLSRGAPHSYITFKFELEEQSDEEDQIRVILENPQFMDSLRCPHYQPLLDKAQFRKEAAQNAAASVMALHKHGPYLQNKDTLRLIAEAIMDPVRVCRSDWKDPPPKPLNRMEWYTLIIFFLCAGIFAGSMYMAHYYQPPPPKQEISEKGWSLSDVQISNFGVVTINELESEGPCPPPISGECLGS